MSELLDDLNKKEYEIGGSKFKFKNLSLDELEEIQQLQARLQGNNSQLNGSYSFEEIKRFLALVLEPVDRDSLTSAEIFGKVKRDLIPEIMGDFFLQQIIFNNSTTDYFKTLLQKYQSTTNSSKD